VDAVAANAAGWRPAALARAFLDGGAAILQIRAKPLPSAAFLDLCDEVVAAGPEWARVIVNDRVDLARMSGAAGVHVGQDDLPPGQARAQLGPSAIIGFSTHSLTQIDAAVREAVNYVAVGPVFGTATKNTGYDPVGLDLVRAARQRVPAHLPIVAIGGITLDRAPSVIEAGASHVAVIGDLLATGDPAARVAAYLAALGPVPNDRQRPSLRV
jgi:thiamine-phosphate pyrophosphorylase